MIKPKSVFENCVEKPSDDIAQKIHAIFAPFLNRVDSLDVEGHRSRCEGQYSLYTLFSKSEKPTEIKPLMLFIRDDGLLELDCGDDKKNIVTGDQGQPNAFLFMMNLTSAFARRLPHTYGHIVLANTANELSKKYANEFSPDPSALLPSEVHNHNSHFKGRDLVLPNGTVIPHLR